MMVVQIQFQNQWYKGIEYDFGSHEEQFTFYRFFEPKLKINNIAKVLITINKLAFVNDISNAPTLISGPIR